ncbi:hypothetical protein RchiOBHm_Chr7g0208491 [Rosa chinensis]|uniref:Rapid ALkalinization Factor n=1 Tax=Rosa chinensis TaxID=74649 RepID=A0A2P6P9Q7_ROSCH|nr:hypothetical protein RchiOBHm_Chr7g0208491 [Rosa chinensis]
MSPHSVAALMILITLVTTTHCINNTITSRSSSWCVAGRTDDPSCLVGETDLDSDEFMMDSEISRRILAGNSGTKNALDPSKASSCDRSNPQCHSSTKNQNPPGVDCAKAQYNRGCHQYP